MKVEQEHIEHELLVTRYLLGDTTSEEKKLLLEWLKMDDSHMQQFQQLKKISDACNRLSEKETYDVDAAIAHFEGHRIPVRSISNVKKLIFAAASVAAVVAIVLTVTFLPKKDTFTQVAQTTNCIKEVPLKDGSAVTLNKHATLSASDEFGDKNRAVKLQGEAYFSVNHDAKRPFVITINDVKIKVLGTRFNVYPDSINHKLTVTVESGRVAILYHAKSTILTKGEKAIVEFDNATLAKCINEDENFISWKTGELYFNDTPLDQVVESINKQYNVQFELASSDLANYQLNASFDYTDVEKVKELLSIVLKVTITGENGKYIISKRDTAQ